MVVLVRLIGIMVMCMGTVFMINPAFARKMMSFWKEGNRIYMAGVMRLLFGAIFLMAARQCRLEGVIFILGILMLLGGALIFIMGPKRTKAIIEKVQEKPDSFLRPMSIVILVFAVLIIYSA